jgi:hypothetical protein
VSSTTHLGARLVWTDLARERGYTPLAVYAQSKVALTMHARTLTSTG